MSAGVHRIHEGDVVDMVRGMREASIDALLCDPPYGFSFMGKAWDYDVPSVDLWRECLRVLKPGAPLLAFGGSRTYHRLACGIEDAGFELRDQLMWLYGKGFPKSQNIGLAIDKAAGATREVAGSKIGRPNISKDGSNQGNGFARRLEGRTDRPSPSTSITAPATALAQAWNGYGTALKPAFEPIVLARKPLEGTMAQNVARWGVGGLAIDACRIASEDSAKPFGTPRKSSGGIMNGTSEARDQYVPDDAGRWPANLLLGHADTCRPTGDMRTVKNGTAVKRHGVTHGGALAFGGIGKHAPGTPDAGYGEQAVEVWECAEDCPVRLLDEQAGDRPSRPSVTRNGGGGGMLPGATLRGVPRPDSGYDDDGGPSRFFFCSKVSPAEREFGCEALPMRSAGEMTGREEEFAGLDSPRTGAGRTSGARNHHPTLKPISLTTWLARLILPPTPGTLLVPFSGAGSEMIGALRAGWSEVVGIERDPEYATIARARIARWAEVPDDFEPAEALASSREAAVNPLQTSFFGGGAR